MITRTWALEIKPLLLPLGGVDCSGNWSWWGGWRRGRRRSMWCCEWCFQWVWLRWYRWFQSRKETQGSSEAFWSKFLSSKSPRFARWQAKDWQATRSQIRCYSGKVWKCASRQQGQWERQGRLGASNQGDGHFGSLECIGNLEEHVQGLRHHSEIEKGIPVRFSSGPARVYAWEWPCQEWDGGHGYTHGEED